MVAARGAALVALACAVGRAQGGTCALANVTSADLAANASSGNGGLVECEQPVGLTLCADISYAACITQGGLVQEARARERLDAIMRRFGYAIELSPECYDVVRLYQCSLEFAACEGFSSDAEQVCDSQCAKVRQACAGLGASNTSGSATNTSGAGKGGDGGIVDELLELDEVAFAMICDLGPPFVDEDCFELGYTGPSYYLWAIGLGMAVGFSFLNAVALNLQKMSLNWYGEDRTVLRQPLWMLGFFLLLMGSLMDFVALGLAPASLLAPLAALSLVWNMVAAPCFLGEKLTRSQALATMVIFMGAVVTVIFSSHASPTYTLQDLERLFLRDSMRVYTVVVPGFIMLHMLAVEIVEKLPEDKRAWRSLQSVHMIGYAGAAGTTGGQSLLFAKATVELFKSAFAGVPGIGRNGETYLIITAMALCMLVQITYLNGALMYHNSLVVVPVYQAYWITSGVIGGLVYFDEIRDMSALQLGIFTMGILVTISGVSFLAMLAFKSTKSVRMRRFSSTGTNEDDDDEIFRDVGHADENAFEAFLVATPRVGVADVLLDMGVQASSVRRLVGNSNPRLRTQHQKELMLRDMGVPPQVAAKMLKTASDRHVLSRADTSNRELPIIAD